VKPTVWARRVPWAIVALAVLLLGCGWIGINRCEDLAGTSGSFLKRQMVFSAIALAALLGLSVPSYRVLCRFSYAVFLFSLVLLAMVYFFPAVNQAHRWIRVGSIGFQPSEFAKVAFVLALARYLMYRENYRRLTGLVIPLALTMLPVLLILKEPDLGTAAVFLPVLFVMLFVAGARRWDLARIALVGLLLLPLLWTQMTAEQKSRVTALFQQPAAGEKPDDDAYHLYQCCRRATDRRPGRLSPALCSQRFHSLRVGRAVRFAGRGRGARPVRPPGVASRGHRRPHP